MKGLIKNMESNIVSNMYRATKSIINCIMYWAMFKWFCAVDLPYIIFPVLSITCNTHTFEICYKIGAMFGSLITMRMIGEIIGYLIGFTVICKKQCTND